MIPRIYTEQNTQIIIIRAQQMSKYFLNISQLSPIFIPSQASHPKHDYRFNHSLTSSLIIFYLNSIRFSFIFYFLNKDLPSSFHASKYLFFNNLQSDPQLFMKQTHISLLDNRKHLTPRASMEHLISYARHQDNSVKIMKARAARGGYLLNFVFFMPLIAYGFYHYSAGYWQSIYPKALVENSATMPINNKRMYFTPEYYFKENEVWHKDLKDAEA